MVALNQVGPVAVAVCANDNFMAYARGVYTDVACNSKSDTTTPNHAVLVVGYGTDTTSGRKLDYWIVKNSWSSRWGDSGYVRMQRGKKLITNPVYPRV